MSEDRIYSIFGIYMEFTWRKFYGATYYVTSWGM